MCVPPACFFFRLFCELYPCEPYLQVHISETATDRVSNSSPTAASMSTDLYGMAALDACEQITERLKPVVAGLPEGAPFSTVVTASVALFVVCATAGVVLMVVMALVVVCVLLLRQLSPLYFSCSCCWVPECHMMSGSFELESRLG